MTHPGTDATSPNVVTVMCMQCGQILGVPAHCSEVTCPGCGSPLQFVRCDGCRWPLVVLKGDPGFACPGCNATRFRNRQVQLVQAAEVSYFQGLSLVAPASPEVAAHAACTQVGGWNTPFGPGTMVSVATTSANLHLTPIGLGGPAVTWPLGELVDLRFSGPGTQTHGRRFWGGGFGLVGAAEGIIAAELLNNLTRKTTTNSLIHLDLNGSGFILHSSRFTPDQLRIKFSAVTGRISARQRSPIPPDGARPAHGIVSDLERLANLHRSGDLSTDEYNQAKAKMLGM